MLENYSRVRLLTNIYREEGARQGDVGYIVEVHNPDAYEVEFSNMNGITFAQIVARRDELQVDEPQQAASAVPFDITIVEIAEILPSTAAPQRVKQPSLK